MSDYKQLDVWKASMELVTQVYQVTRYYPKEELYALTSQTRRAAVSVAANIAEGVGRQYKRDTLQFLHIARGSLYELETLLIVAKNAELINEAQLSGVVLSWQRTVQLLNGFINYYEKTELK